jgi:hypothetical protein
MVAQAVCNSLPRCRELSTPVSHLHEECLLKPIGLATKLMVRLEHGRYATKQPPYFYYFPLLTSGPIIKSLESTPLK